MDFSRFENMTHVVGTSILVFLYALRIAILLRRRLAKDRAFPKGKEWTGILWAYFTIFMPWSMDSTWKHWPRYLEFAIFHLGILFNILTSFLITYACGLLATPVREVFAVFIGAGLIVGLVRFVRRIATPHMRIISTPDDYASLALVILFLAFALPALYGSEAALIVYFIIAFFFLIYEPFSKIRHYIYFPFARYFYGASLGRKGMLK